MLNGCKSLFLGQKILQHFNINSWKDLLRENSKVMYELDSEVFESFVKHKDFEGRDRRIISNTPEDMNTPFQLAENIFIETNLNANTILNYCKLIVEKYGVQNDVYFKLKQA